MVSLLLIAASGLAREVLSVLEPLPDAVAIGILDDNPGVQGTSVGGVPVLGSLEAVRAYPDSRLLVCAGHGAVRSRIIARLTALGVTDERFATLIDDSVHVPRSCVIGSGTILLAHTVLTADVEIGRHVVIMPNATLTHDNRIGDYATLCAGVSLGGAVRVGEAAYLGMNAAVRENLTVGASAVLGMGAVLLHDLPAGATWVGVPAAPAPQMTTIRRYPRNPEPESALA
jgi:sugar O-acyltransferase (sialic acid O-acetyltransferase NeuD family)